VGSNPTGGMDVCRECCVLSGRTLCDALITRQEESYWLWLRRCVWSRNLKNEEVMARVVPQRHGGDHTYLTTVSEVECIKSNGRIIRDLINSEVPVSRAKWSYRNFKNWYVICLDGLRRSDVRAGIWNQDLSTRCKIALTIRCGVVNKRNGYKYNK